MILFRKLEEQHISSSMHPDKGAAFVFAIEKLSKIAGPYFKIYGIDCTLSLSFGYNASNEGDGKELHIFPAPENSPFNKNWNKQSCDETRDSAILELKTLCEMLRKAEIHREITITESAEMVLDGLDSKSISSRLNAKNVLMSKQWGCAHVNALKLCGIYAMSDSFYTPLITEKIALECVGIVEQSIEKLWLHMIKNGCAKQTIEEQQRSQLHKLLLKQVESSEREDNIITRSLIQRRLSNCAPFRNDISGPRDAIYRNIGYLCADGVLIRVEGDSSRSAAKYKINNKFFQ